MSTAKVGDKVNVHYTGKLEDGTVFDSSEGRDPLEVTLGESKVIPGFEQAIVGMEVGASKTANIESDSAYGPRRDELVVQFEKEKIPEGVEPEVGQQLQLQTNTGQPVPARVVDIDDAGVTLDANHPLAGKDLTFEIELVDIVEEGPSGQA